MAHFEKLIGHPFFVKKLEEAYSYSKNGWLSAGPFDGRLGAKMSVKVKICGITNPADAAIAAEAGADALGFNFCDKSPRYLAVPAAAAITRTVPPHIVRVGVFVNPDEDLVMRAMGECGLTLLQFHGEETPDFCLQFGLMSMKAFRVCDAESLKPLLSYPTDAWLLDAYSPAQHGGTGERFNWDLAIQARQWGKPIFLAGGLTAENVAQAIQQAQPYAVDVSSGVEMAPGKKDPEKLRAFIRAAKETGSAAVSPAS
jgi:phosphoribosylanthranilate isomerase